MTNHVHVSSSQEAWEEALRLLSEGVSGDGRVTWSRIHWGRGNRQVVDLGGGIRVTHGAHGDETTMIWID